MAETLPLDRRARHELLLVLALVSVATLYVTAAGFWTVANAARLPKAQATCVASSASMRVPDWAQTCP